MAEMKTDMEQCFQLQQNLINLGNAIWDTNWSWTVTKQEIDYVIEDNNTYEVAVASFVRIVVKPVGIERENMGYGYKISPEKRISYCFSRKLSIINALKETIYSFGGEIAKRMINFEQSQITTASTHSNISNPIFKTPVMLSKPGISTHNTNSADHLKSNQPIASTSRIYNENIESTSPNYSTVNKGPVVIQSAVTPNITENISINQARYDLNPANAISRSGTSPSIQPGPVHAVGQFHQQNCSTSKSEEELRADRRRRQKEKQEEFKRQMQTKSVNKPSDAILEMEEDPVIISTQDMAAAVMDIDNINNFIKVSHQLSTEPKNHAHGNFTKRNTDIATGQNKKLFRSSVE